ncbi:hypothetical protein [Clostridium beijerinckii]|uniref:hypothetical protein n=1 Tax=Clostridium beijerinckii TaxID=1520 RepID=UPI0012B1661A|nr:hypothetical protein [Clostridium beijerinckii]MRY42789.1 hypothetical protein [Parabacteroides distasonis]MZK51874.1 hypothetical protein [Clostridium beijerinckii]MZK61873.1 hypothetical protein [Clostridium beijerinckii]MZK70287.1 hypothetical protein [Clostridium beijerinckii]MZK77436.1 hypothetical protein [Clostridium beijerinckii]
MIKPDGLNLIYNSITSNLLKGQALIDGQYKDIEIQKTELTSNSVKVFLYLDESFVGQITNYRLITIAGKVFLERSENIAKNNTKGLLVLFEIVLQEG